MGSESRSRQVSSAEYCVDCTDGCLRDAERQRERERDNKSGGDIGRPRSQQPLQRSKGLSRRERGKERELQVKDEIRNEQTGVTW